MAIRVTKMQKFTALKEMLDMDAMRMFDLGEEGKYTFDYNEALAFLDKEIDALAKRSNASAEEQSEKQKQAKEDGEIVYNYLLDVGKAVNYLDIIRNVEEFSDRYVSSQYIASCIGPWVEEGKIIRYKENKKTLLKAKTDEEEGE